jgi:hypothetical protein
MRARFAQQPQLPVRVSESDELFTEQLNSDRLAVRICHLLRQ